MIINILDKLIFGTLLVLVFQVPIISDHYLQFISGYYEATKVQVDGFKANAARHEYSDVYAMVNELLNNSSSVIRTDAEQKLRTLQEFEQLEQAIVTLREGNIFQRAWYVFQPERWEALNKVLENYQPGIPLGVGDVLLSILVALLLSIALMWPFKWLSGSGK
ncbi:MAG: DUF2937 family protein [Thiolinea sp.]